MSFRLGSPYSGDKAIAPGNTGTSGYAQERLNNTVARFVQQHKNALMVDGNPIYLWYRNPEGMGGVQCTCQQRHSPKSFGSLDPNIKTPREYDNMTSVSQGDGAAMAGQFKLVHLRGGTSPGFSPNISQETEKAFPQIGGENLNERYGDQFEENSAPDGIQNSAYDKNEIARFLDDSYGGGLFGGDSTACPICYSTGRINGYQIHNGGRIVLESSGYWPFTASNVDILSDRYPTAFRILSNGYVQWTIDLPFSVYRWCSLGILNKTEKVDSLQVQVFWQNEWQAFSSDWLYATNGQDRSNLQIRVLPASDVTQDASYDFTHVDLRYMQSDPIPAQCSQLDFPVDYEFSDIIINTSFEVLAESSYFPRESYFQDSKYGFIWKVNSITPHTTANNQVFGYEVQVRRITKAEMFYSMALIKPKTIDHWDGFNGLQYIQGNIPWNKFPGTDKNAWNVADNMFSFPEKDDDLYPGEKNSKKPAKPKIPPQNNAQNLPDFE